MSLSRTMRLAETQVTLRTPLLLLGLWAVLAPGQCSKGRPSWRYISSEVVIPRKELQSGKGVQMPGWVSYSLRFGGQRHVIHMRRKKLFVPRHLLLMTQDDQGALQVDSPFIPQDCYYLGYLEEIPLSMVTVETCYGGIEGIMKLDDLAYEIKPLKDSQRFEHIVSQIVADTNATGPAYRLGYKEDRDALFSQANASAEPRLSSRVFASHYGSIKALVMTSNRMYRVYNNVSKCATFLIHLSTIIDSIWRGLDLGMFLTAIVIFDQRDPADMNDHRVPGSGYLEEIPLSMVTVETCYGGIEGIMKLDDLAYEIKPLKDSQRFEHIVSQIVADTNATGPAYRLGYKEDRDALFSQANASAEPRLSSRVFASHYGSIKALVMTSNRMYRVYNNVSKCATFLIHLSTIIDSIWRGLDLGMFLTAIVIFDQRDPADMNDHRVPGSAFYNYFSNTLYRAMSPHSSLIVKRDGPHELQFSPGIYSMCKAQNLIMLGALGRHYLLLAIIASQQIGRSFGLYFDESTCVCQRRTTCIMYRYPVMTDAFSNCSFLHTQHILGNDVSLCVFFTQRVYLNKSLTQDRCGNHVVEETEQCDCGSFKQCYSSPCCNSNCRFTTGSACDTGRCCTNCTFSPVGTLCRPIQNICDLPEYCRGLSSMQDGTPCTEDGYCYRGNCTDRSIHCKEIFGGKAVNAPRSCYEINKRANRFGHCRRAEMTYRFGSCANADILCGRLQCINVTHLPQLQEHVAFHQSLILDHLCFGVGSHRGTGTTDVGPVRDGSLCDSGRYCQNSYCNGSIEAMNYDCTPEKCNLRGVCNNLRHCHCHEGWEPPRCLQKGAGGSVDSGPPPRKQRKVTASLWPVVYLRVLFARIYALIAALLFGVATNVRTVKVTEVKEVTVGETKR
nr:PREDICTED: LOW QUALITY PROTEIN: disintegrin and metalloproteinase domain-containing protein 21-like [Equus przewalskii]